MGLLTLQFGQCGNQIGQTLFNYLVDDITDTKVPQILKSFNKEYVNSAKRSWFTESQNSTFKPRSILVDTENKVISSLINEKNSLVYKNVVSHSGGGSANNWALGYANKSDLLKNDVMEIVRKEMEESDHLLHLLNIFGSGGGTGSGVGSRIIEYLRDDYPNKHIVNVIILPYQKGEVVTQSYNTILTLSKLYDITDSIIILENDVLHNICDNSLAIKNIELRHLNFLIAQKLCALFQPVSTFSLTDFIIQLTSHPNFKLVQIETAPHVAYVEFECLRGWANLVTHMRSRLRASKETWNLTSRDRHMLTAHYHKSIGNVLISRGGDLPVEHVVEPLKEKQLYPKWLPVCRQLSYFHQPRRLYKTHEYLALATNNNSVCDVLNPILTQAWNLFQHKAYLHFYTKYGVNENIFQEAFEKLEFVFNNYKHV